MSGNAYIFYSQKKFLRCNLTLENLHNAKTSFAAARGSECFAVCASVFYFWPNYPSKQHKVLI